MTPACVALTIQEPTERHPVAFFAFNTGDIAKELRHNDYSLTANLTKSLSGHISYLHVL